MIVFTRLNRTALGLNPDQIQRVESTPDTVISLNDEKRFLVLESLDEVVRMITEYRAYVLALSNAIDVSAETAARPALHLVSDGDTVAGGTAAGDTDHHPAHRHDH